MMLPEQQPRGRNSPAESTPHRSSLPLPASQGRTESTGELGLAFGIAPGSATGPRIRRGGVYICFILLAVLCSVLAIFALLLATPSPPGLPLLVVLGISIALVAVAWWGLSRLRCYQGTPRRLVAMALWWGASVSSVLAVFTAADAASEIPEKLGLPIFSTAFGGAWPEEITKALGIWMLLWIARDWWNRPHHGLLAGVFVGLGMEVYENSLYALFLGVLHPASDVTGAASVYGMRLLFGIGLHAVFSGLVGYGIGRALWGPRERSRAWRCGQVFGWGFAGFALHFLWNISWPDPVAPFVLAAVWVTGVAALVTCFYREEKGLRQVEGTSDDP
ncbi:PrsW family intramembrane metalloprotease [Corynebacterium urealyticum]|uniref:Putative membrane protein n=2 Tax=Corynebacterium urealyticum TaxID=43771 RepID=B1VE73_CORU7|nr:PrsW family intramembrane metalloprotease [Corynebacterium urealyticum]CAQ04062.1 putative membrane protein [Corynebacterium urealyticum DSM 7109]